MGYLCDNCPSLYNPEQEDQERDLVGYLCEADKDTDRRRLMISDSTISHRSSHSPIIATIIHPSGQQHWLFPHAIVFRFLQFTLYHTVALIVFPPNTC